MVADALYHVLSCVSRPIIVLPPASVQVVYCELTESEKDFYGALFKRSKVGDTDIFKTSENLATNSHIHLVGVNL